MSKRKLRDISNQPKLEFSINEETAKSKSKKIKKDENEENLEEEVVILDDDSNNEGASKSKSAREVAIKCDSEMNIDEEFVKLNICLKKAINPDLVEFAIEGEAQDLLPYLICLEVKNFGIISLPFQDPQASELIKRCEQSPFGKKDKTLLDKHVRDSYQLDPSQFSINHPDWNKKLNELATKVAEQFGCEKKIEAKIYKLLVYKKGGHFLKHQDTEKDKRMFGTLIIQLPSIHTGGELVIHDSTKKLKKVIDFGQKTGKSKSSIHFAAHYADLEHELLVVKSGYRLALVYSLCWAHDTRRVVDRPIANVSLTNELVEVLNLLNNNPYHLGVLLEHQYTHQSFSENGIGALKGADHKRYDLLAQANKLLPADKQLAFYICHASLKIGLIEAGDIQDDYNDEEDEENDDDDDDDDDDEKDSESGSSASSKESKDKISEFDQDSNDSKEDYFGCYWSENERDYAFEDWYDVNGKSICHGNTRIGLDFFTKVFNPSDAERNDAVDLEQKRVWGKYLTIEIEGYTGNECAYKDIQYNKYLLVMWPKKFQFDFMLKLDLTGQINAMYHSIVEEKKPIDEEIKSNYEALMRHFEIQTFQFNLLNCKHFSQIFELIRIFNKKENFKSFLVKNIQIKFSANTVKNFGLAVSHFGFESLKSSLKKFFKVDIRNFTKICRFVQILNESSEEELAREIFNNFLLPFIQNTKQSKEIIELAFGFSGNWHEVHFEFDSSVKQFNDFTNLIKLYIMFPDQTIPLFETLKSMVENLMNEKDRFSSFIDSLVNHKNAIQCCSPLVEVVEKRKQWLEEKLAERPSFSWRMPNASIQNHPTVETFLKGDQQSMDYTFRYVKDLRDFIKSHSNTYSWGRREYSVEMKEKPGKVVHIKKTRSWFEQQEKMFDSYANELLRIKNLLDLK